MGGLAGVSKTGIGMRECSHSHEQSRDICDDHHKVVYLALQTKKTPTNEAIATVAGIGHERSLPDALLRVDR